MYMMQESDMDIKKETTDVKRVMIGLKLGPVGGDEIFDVDASVTCMGPSGRHESTIDFENKRHSSGAIIYSGFTLTALGEGYDQEIQINLDQVPATVDKMVIAFNIYEAHSRGRHFGKVPNSFVCVKDMDTHGELLRWGISSNHDYNGKTGIFFAEVYRYNGEWRFKVID